MSFINGEIPQAAKFNDLVTKDGLTQAVIDASDELSGYTQSAQASADLATQNSQICQNAATTAVNAAQSASVVSNIFVNLTAAQAAITAGTIPSGTLFNTAGTTANVYVDQYLNSAGTPVYQRSLSSQQFVDQVNTLATSTDTRTNGLLTTSTSVNPFEILGQDGKGWLALDSNAVLNAYGGMQTKAITDVTPADDAYSGAFVTNDGKVLFGFRSIDGIAIYLGEPLNNHRGALSGDFFAIGDSITAYGVAWSGENNGGTSYAPTLDDRSWHTWAMLLSNSRLRLTGISATGGYTVTQVLTTHLPNAIAAAPTFCVVMCGRNDIVQGIDITNVTIPAFYSLFRGLRQNGIIPVVCTMSAQNNSADNTRRTAEHQLNNWLRAYARRYKLPLIDLHRYTVDPATGDWISGYNRPSDPSHPSKFGAAVMGQALSDGLLDWTAPVFPPRADEQVTLGLTGNTAPNPLFLTNNGTNPTGWTITTAGTASITTDSAVKGNVWNLQNQQAYLPVTVTPGNTMQLSFFMNTPGGSLFEFYALAGDQTSTTHLAGIRQWSGITTGWGFFAYEFVVPAGITTVTIMANVSTSMCSVAQLGLINITTGV